MKEAVECQNTTLMGCCLPSNEDLAGPSHRPPISEVLPWDGEERGEKDLDGATNYE